MKKIIVVLIMAIELLFLSTISISFAKYTSSNNGKISVSVAKPIARLEIKNEGRISNYEQIPINFSIHNFDESGKISDVKMKYKIIIKTTQDNAPLTFKLYRVGDRDEMININISNGIITQTEGVTMIAGTKITHNYRLEIEYDDTSNINLDQNFGMSICMQSEQIRI